MSYSRYMTDSPGGYRGSDIPRDHINRIGDMYARLYFEYRVVLPGFRNCAACGGEKKINRIQSRCIPAGGAVERTESMLVAVCAECFKSGALDSLEVGQWHPNGFTPIEDPEGQDFKEQYLKRILNETRRYYDRHPHAYKVMKNGGPAYQSPTAKEYLEYVDSTFQESLKYALQVRDVIDKVK